MHNLTVEEEILAIHRKHKVQLQHSVWLLCKHKGLKLADLAEGCGYHRNYLYMSLSGAITPALEFRNAITDKLGIDPWDFVSDK